MISLDWKDYEIEIRHHVFVRAMERSITPDLIDYCIMNGKVKRFGKNYVKFITKSLICVGEVSGLKLKIITIERRKK